MTQNGETELDVCLEEKKNEDSNYEEEKKENAGGTIWYRLKAKFASIRPPSGQINFLLTIAVLSFLCYGMLVSISPRLSLPITSNSTVTVFPPKNGSVFLLYTIFIACLIAGFLASKIRVPELLGMLLVGILLRNLPLDLWVYAEKSWIGILRKTAFVVILIQGGLGLDVSALRRLKSVVLRLAFFPCIAEAATVAVTAHLVLDFPWIPGFLMGFVLGAVSPAVCVPSMLKLQSDGFGVAEGIPTLVIAASSTDDVLAITAFSVLLSVAFSQGGLVMTIFKGPIDMSIGIAYGLFFGWLAWFFPEHDNAYCTLLRYLYLFLMGMVGMFGSVALDVDGAGCLACLVGATVAAAGWSKQPGDTSGIEKAVSVTWVVFQPFLFGLIGAEIDVSTVDLPKLGLSLLILGIGIIVRTMVAFFALCGEKFTIRDRVFVALAWLPKATVQAALGPIYYDTVADDEGNLNDLDIGIQILTMAVLGILVTAPLGAALISLTGPYLLNKTEEDSQTTATSTAV